MVAVPVKTDAPISGNILFFQNGENIEKIDSTPPYLYLKSIDQNYKLSQCRMIINCRKLCPRLFLEELSLGKYIVRQPVVPFSSFIL